MIFKNPLRLLQKICLDNLSKYFGIVFLSKITDLITILRKIHQENQRHGLISIICDNCENRPTS